MASTTVATASEEYDEASKKWKLPRSLMGGTRAMRDAAETYLPREPAESPDAYKCRLQRTTLFNGFRKTVRDMTGRVFDKPIVIEKDVPAELVTMAEDIDNAGKHINVFAKDAFKDALVPGIGYILTDMPTALQPGQGTGRNGEVTRADEQKRRPYLTYLRAEDVIEFKTAVINGKRTPVRVRIFETVTEQDPNDEFNTVKVDQVRVLRPGAWEIWRKATSGPDNGKWVIVSAGTTSVPKITIAEIPLDKEQPPLQDLADLNVAHWQSTSDQRNILHVARVPILFGSGIPEETEIVIGGNTMVRASDAAATLQYVEHSGNAIGSGDKDLQNLEFQMQTQGLQLLIPQPGGKTATGEVHDDVKENSPLAFMAVALQDALELSLGFMAEYLALGEGKGGSLKVNTDFGISAGAAVDVPQILAAYAAGLIDKQTAIEELKRRNLLSDSVDPETVIARAEAEAQSALDAAADNAIAINESKGAAGAAAAAE